MLITLSWIPLLSVSFALFAYRRCHSPMLYAGIGALAGVACSEIPRFIPRGNNPLTWMHVVSCLVLLAGNGYINSLERGLPLRGRPFWRGSGIESGGEPASERGSIDLRLRGEHMEVRREGCVREWAYGSLKSARLKGDQLYLSDGYQSLSWLPEVKGREGQVQLTKKLLLEIRRRMDMSKRGDTNA